MSKLKKYIMIVTSEDDRYDPLEAGGVSLMFFANAPWEGLFYDVVHGDSAEELMDQGDFEGLFYQLYDTKSGERIGFGTICLDFLKENITEFERKKTQGQDEGIFDNNEERKEKLKRLEDLKKTLVMNLQHLPKETLETRYKCPYESLIKEIAILKKEVGRESR